MFTPSDIVIFILLVGSVIFIWIARRSSPTYKKDAPKTPHQEIPPPAGQMGTHGETNNQICHGQSKTEDAHVTERELNRPRNTSHS